MLFGRPPHRLLLPVLCCSLPLLGACRSPSAPADDEGSAEVAVATAPSTAALGPEREVDAEGSAAPAARTAATRPDTLLLHVPANAEHVALLDVAALRRAVIETVGSLNDESMAIASAITALRRAAADAPALEIVDWGRAQAAAIVRAPEGLVVIVAASAIDGAPEPGASVGQGARRVTRIGEIALVGDEAAVAAASATEGAGLMAWEGWSRLSTEAAITWFADDVAHVAPSLRSEVGFVADGSRIGVAIGVDGALELVFDATDTSAAARALGRGQAFANAALGVMRSEAHPSLEPWVAWLNAIERALWSRLSLEEAGGVVVVRYAGATCGGPLANLASVGVLSALVRAGAVDGAAPDIDFAPVTGSVAAGCAPLGTEPASLPRTLARLGDPDPGVAGALVVFDQAAILRRGLPRAFGLLPFALSRESIERAFGDGPFGFDDFATREGSGAWHAGAGPAGRWRHAIVLHPGAASLVRSGPIFGLASAEIDGAFSLFTPLVDVPARLESADDSLWTDAMAHAAAESSLAIVVNGALVNRLAGGLENNVVVSSIVSTGWLLVDVGAPTGTRIVFEVRDAARRLPEVRAAIAPLLMAIVDKAQSQAPLDQAVRTAIEAAIADGLEQMRFEAAGDVVEVTAGAHPVATLGAVAARVLFPVIGGSIQRGPVEFPGGRNPWATP